MSTQEATSHTCPKCGAKTPCYSSKAHMCGKCGWTWTKDLGMNHLELAVRVLEGKGK